MKWRVIATALVLLSLAKVASAHRLDEYLQATLISVDEGQVQLSMRLIPGVAVSSAVIAGIDSNRDGVLSQAEQFAYAERVIRDLSLSLDGKVLEPKLVFMTFPPLQQMRDGLGEIHLELQAPAPNGGPDRKLILESRQRGSRTVHLVNALLPRDPQVRIVAQKRNETQSTYELDYAQSLAGQPQSVWSGLDLLGSRNLFHLGLRHIAEGSDHLLFLLVLLLPAPLMAVGGRWQGTTGLRNTLLRILRIVTAFTLGHSITLALASLGLVRVPGRPVEVLIAVSILVSAVHALRPIFPGKEAGIAAFFGLIHGLAFASTLSGLGIGGWQRLAGILAFNLGIETMQLVVVAATLPSLLLLSRTGAYRWLRTGGAVLAAAASTGWMAERMLGLQSSVDVVVDGLAHRAVWIAASLFVTSLVCWSLELRRRTVLPRSTVSLVHT